MPRKAPRRATDEVDKYPNMQAEREWDRAQHIKKGMQAGLTKKEAIRHADQDIDGK